MSLVKMLIAPLLLASCLFAAGCSQKYSDLNCEELAQVEASEEAKAAASEAAFQKDAKSSDEKAMKVAQENVVNARFQQGEKKCSK